MHIRTFQLIYSETLRAVFHSSIHQLARQHYTAEQLRAWAQADYDASQWAERLRVNRPWVAEVDGFIAGFADVPPSGLIDDFFCEGAVCRARCWASADRANPSGVPAVWAYPGSRPM